MIGGGPAGATAATLLAERGRSVVVLERERFPRFHVGESLLPFTNPVLDRLGATDRVAGAGFVVKRGATFVFEDGSTGSAIRFAEGLDGDHGATYQVERDRFDRILLENASLKGAAVLQQTRADEICLDHPDRVEVLVRAADAPRSAEAHRIGARYLIDASGQSGFVSKRLKLRQTDPQLRNVALYAHFAPVSLPRELPPGDIQIVSLSNLGWLWIIPLDRDRASVGVVAPQAVLRQNDRGDRDHLLERLVASSQVVSPQLRDSRQLTPTRFEANFSYRCHRYVGERWLLSGDAASFLDPVFSTGVLLALESGAEAADAVASALARGGADNPREFARYQRSQRRRYRHFSKIVRRFYDPAFRDLLCQPSGRLRIPAAMTTILAGARRPSWGVRWRLAVFEAIARAHRARPILQRLHRVGD